MKRRRLIALISLFTLLGIAVLTALAGVVVMRTDIARDFVQATLARSINGSVYVGRISGNPLAGITVDTFAIRDTSGELVVSTGRLTVAYDIRDLTDSRLYLRQVTVDNPHIHLRDFGEGRWNYQTLRKGKGGGPAKGPGRSWGDFVVVDSLRATNASFFLSLPWSPDTALRGAARDSAIRYELSRRDRRIERNPGTNSGFARTYMWTRARAFVSHARLADPDSNRFGQEFHVASLDANEFDPPFRFRNVRGRIRRLGDSVWLDLSHWDLPGSTGSATGKVVWGSDLPMRYDLVVRGDSVRLADVNWVYPTLPTTGGGRMILRISNKRNLRVMDYHIDSMDVRTTGSRLIGEMTFGVGGGILQVRNVNLKADPVDFAFIKALNGKPFPIDWRGQIFGDVRAPGGPVDDFQVAAARGEWRDAHIPGAVSRLSGSGGLDIQFPALTAFHGFDLDVEQLDLRSIQNLFPAFPKLDGTLSGQATLDSIWTDVRFSDADITHRDGPGTPSRFTGSGRVTDGSPFITYDVDLVADPLSFDMLARSFPALTLRGVAYGPLAIKGQSHDLQITTNLVSAAGALRFAGNIDIDSLGGYGARGVGEITNVDLSKLGVRANAPATSLSGLYTIDVRGSTPATLTGTADVSLGRSTYDRTTVDSLSRTTIRFDAGRAYTTDSLIISSPMGRVTAFGALGLPGGGTDSISVTLDVDSLGSLRPYFTAAGTPVRPDSLAGQNITVNGYATGRLDSLSVRGSIAGEGLFVRGIAIGKLDGTFDFADVLRSPSGVLNARLSEKVTVAGLQFDTVDATVTVRDTANATFSVAGRGFGRDSLSMNGAGAWRLASGSTALRLDAFDLGFGSSQWTLQQPATLVVDSSTFRIDTLGLRNTRGGSIGLAGSVPTNGAIDLRLSATQVPLFDIDRVVGQVQAPLSGFANLSARVTGTREAPVIDAATTMDSVALSDVRVGRLLANARYASNVGSVNADIFQGDKRVLHAVADSLPLSIKWFDYDTLSGPLRVSAVADSADFTLIQAWVSDISNVTGKVSGRLSLDGTWARPNLLANASLTAGGMRIDTLGIALSGMYGRVEYRGDTLHVDTLSAHSGGDRHTASIGGKIAFANWEPSWFDLSMRMNNFLAYDRPELATIYARTDSGPVRLRGTFADDSLVGVVNIDSGAIYLPDPKLAGKRFSAIDSLGFTGEARDRTLYERVTQNLFTNLRAHIGGDFRLSAEYASIPLTGELQIVPVATTDVAQRSGDYISRLAPVGVINADRGTYTLDYFPIRKTFDVQRGGTITFDRDAQWNGVLDVSAQYVIRKPGRPDIPIIVEVTNRLLTPKVTPRSGASFPISDSDLISYLVFEEPGFDVLGQTRRTGSGEGLVSSLFTPIATSIASQQLQTLLRGRWLDQFRLETANLDQSATTTDGNLFSRYFYASRLRGEKELWGDVFVSVSAGACGFRRDIRESTGENFGGLGLSLDWRLTSALYTGSTLRFATEPSTKALLCSADYLGSQGVAATPRQVSLSYLKFWRW